MGKDDDIVDDQTISGNCAICLEPVSGESFLDQCFHIFCFHCILQWSELLLARPQSTSSRLQCLKCPLCKTPYTSVIHDLSGDRFQRYYFMKARSTSPDKLDYFTRRRAVYAKDAEPSKSSSSATIAPKPNRWLSLWVQRELQALMQEDDVEPVTQHVVGIVEAFGKRVGGQAKHGRATSDLDWHVTISSAVRPFIFELAEKFSEELSSFLLSGVDIAAYDHRSEPTSSSSGIVKRIGDRDSQLRPKEIHSASTCNLYDEDIEENYSESVVEREPANPSNGELSEVTDLCGEGDVVEEQGHDSSPRSIEHKNKRKATEVELSRRRRRL